MASISDAEVSPAELRKRRLQAKSEERMAKILNSYGTEPGVGCDVLLAFRCTPHALNSRHT